MIERPVIVERTTEIKVEKVWCPAVFKPTASGLFCSRGMNSTTMPLTTRWRG